VGGRGRLLPGLFLEGHRWPSSKLREEAERQAFNHLIQGTGMEELRKAMLRIDGLYADDIWALLAIHDELIYEVPEGSAELDAAMIADHVSVEFKGVRLKVTHSVGSDWGSLK
jgi:DNA polymerase I-like protein with 3'-5' exonuclease and polymerase domains